ncbi:MAG: hypothetical protein ACOYVF_07955 [Candidatus Zixiibacteriota bacterium]
MRKVFLTALFIVGSASSSQAANLAVITSPPTILNILVLLFAFACFFICFQVLNLVRGGQLSRSWQMFMFGFALLALSQVAYLLTVFEIFVVPSFTVPALMTLMVGLFLYGMFEMKRVLS